MIMRKKINFLTLLLLLVGFVTKAQETTSEIQGAITDDKTGLNGATITAIHSPTGTKYVTTSRKDGSYNLANVRVGGPYIITVSFVGYKEEKQDDIFLTLGNAYKADFKLVKTSSNLTEVVVTGYRSDKVFSRSRTGSAEVITRQQIDRLPSANRSIQDFTRLTPTANGNSFGGRSGSYNNLTVNGASFNNTFGLSGSLGGQTSSQPFSIDALEQVQVNLAPYDVTLGNFTGAGINAVTKSGTNQFKGSVYNYWKTPELTGTKIGRTTIARQDFNFKNRGASIGGPIIKNKLFFFVSGEQERISTPATARVASRGGSTGDNVSQAKAEELDKLKKFLIVLMKITLLIFTAIK
jgi:Carboxypeptidase regulatory-like domain